VKLAVPLYLPYEFAKSVVMLKTTSKNKSFKWSQLSYS